MANCKIMHGDEGRDIRAELKNEIMSLTEEEVQLVIRLLNASQILLPQEPR